MDFQPKVFDFTFSLNSKISQSSHNCEPFIFLANTVISNKIPKDSLHPSIGHIYVSSRNKDLAVLLTPQILLSVHSLHLIIKSETEQG